MSEQAVDELKDVQSNILVVSATKTDEEFAKKVAERAMGREVSSLQQFMTPARFSARDPDPRFHNGSAKDKDVFIIACQGPFQDPESVFYRSRMAGRAAIENGARSVSMVAPDWFMGRGDRGPQDEPGNPDLEGRLNVQRMVAEDLANDGFRNVLTTMIHCPDRTYAEFARAYKLPNPVDGSQIVIDLPLEAIFADAVLHESKIAKIDKGYLANGGEGIITVRVDTGAGPFHNAFRKALFLPNASEILIKKIRRGANDPDKLEIVLEGTSENYTGMKGKKLLVPDDGADTLGTLIGGVNTLYTDEEVQRQLLESQERVTYGTPDGVVPMFAHPWLAGRGYEGVQQRLAKEMQGLHEVFMANTHPFISSQQHYSLKPFSAVIRLADAFGDLILTVERAHLAGEVDTAKAEAIRDRYRGFASEAEQHDFIQSHEWYEIKRQSSHPLGSRPQGRIATTYKER